MHDHDSLGHAGKSRRPRLDFSGGLCFNGERPRMSARFTPDGRSFLAPAQSTFSPAEPLSSLVIRGRR